MSEFVRRSLLLVVLATLPGAESWAQVPSALTSSVPPCITLVGSNGVVPNPAGTFTVVVRDAGNNPIPNVGVIIELINVPEARLCPNQLNPNLTVNCVPNSARQICAVTNINGVATFVALGTGFGPAVSQTALGEVWANQTPSCTLGGGSVQIGAPAIAMVDLNGDGVIGANDLSIWISDFASALPWTRSDYDCTGSVGANDLSFWLTFFGGGSTITCVGC